MCTTFKKSVGNSPKLLQQTLAHPGHRHGQQEGSGDLADKIGLLPDLS